MKSVGRIASWNDKKGYGFIEPYSGTGRIFVHIKAFAGQKRRPEVGQVVTFTMTADKHGRHCAVTAEISCDLVQHAKDRKGATLSIVAATTFLLSVGVAVAMDKVPPLIMLLYASTSLITFSVYAWDKSASRKGGWRTPESKLHLLALLGGWPGAMIAQQTLRHKSKKRSFRSVFWMTVILNCVGFAWLYTQKESATLQSLLAHAKTVYLALGPGL